jgi:sulfur relay (sulfurtransferase) complex TusBCD TusD component (DsrE family)
MARYLLIETRDPFESRDVANWYRLAADLERNGNQVTLFLVQNGVLPARRGAQCEDLTAILGTRVEVLADDFSLRERGIAPDSLSTGVRAAPLEVVVDRLAEGCRALWH